MAAGADLARLWAPWRTRFLTRRRVGPCFLCAAGRSRADRRNHVIARGERVFALLNRFPYNNGHVMMAPYRHVGQLEALTPAEWQGLLDLSRTVLARIRRSLHPHGYNLGLNLGKAAGAGVPGHLHLHIVPRWSGDTNFMTVASGSKVISQSLEELHRLLRSPS